MNEIHRVLKYSSGKRVRLVDHDGIERSIQEIVDRYYTNFDECFTTDNRFVLYQNSIRYDYLVSNHVSKEYHCNRQNDTELQSNINSYPKNIIIQTEQPKELFDSDDSNNFLYSNKNDLPSRLNGKNTPTQSTVQSNEII